MGSLAHETADISGQRRFEVVKQFPLCLLAAHHALQRQQLMDFAVPGGFPILDPLANGTDSHAWPFSLCSAHIPRAFQLLVPLLLCMSLKRPYKM